MTSFGSAALGLPVFLLFCFPLWGRLRRLERRIGWRAHRPAPAAPLEEGTPP
jgi:hypothetical protein